MIQIDSEQMLVNTVTSAGGNNWTLTVTRGYNGTTEAAHTAGGGETVYKALSGSTIFVTNSGPSSPISQYDVIEVDNEEMQVTQIPVSDGGQVWQLSVTRHFNGTSASSHASGAVVYKVVSTSQDGTSSSPVPCAVSTGTITLQPGTYYGGICIGAANASSCSNSSSPTNCVASGGSSSSVTAFSQHLRLLVIRTVRRHLRHDRLTRNRPRFAPATQKAPDGTTCHSGQALRLSVADLLPSPHGDDSPEGTAQ